MNRQQEIAQAITTLIVNALVIINMILQAKGLPAVEVGNEEVSMTINAVLVVIMTLYSWWRNNNITPAAIAGQQVINAIKEGEDVDIEIDDDEQDNG